MTKKAQLAFALLKNIPVPEANQFHRYRIFRIVFLPGFHCVHDVTGHIFDVFQLACADFDLLFLFFVFSL